MLISIASSLCLLSTSLYCCVRYLIPPRSFTPLHHQNIAVLLFGFAARSGARVFNECSNATTSTSSWSGDLVNFAELELPLRSAPLHNCDYAWSTRIRRINCAPIAKKCGRFLPVHAFDLDQPKVTFVDQFRALKRVAWAAPPRI